MSRRIRVAPEYLRQASQKIGQQAEQYKSYYEEMYREIDSMASSWSGADNQAFTTQIQGFLPDLERMYQLMTEYGNFLNQSAQVYERVQNETIAYARRLTN